MSSYRWVYITEICRWKVNVKKYRISWELWESYTISYWYNDTACNTVRFVNVNNLYVEQTKYRYRYRIEVSEDDDTWLI